MIIRGPVNTPQRKAGNCQNFAEPPQREVITKCQQRLLGPEQGALHRITGMCFCIIVLLVGIVVLEDTAGNKQLTVDVAKSGGQQLPPLDISTEYTQGYV